VSTLTYTSAQSDTWDDVVTRIMERSQPAWDAGLRASGTTGEHIDVDGTRHVAERRLHLDDAGRPAFWQSSCPCSFESGLHYGSPFLDATSGAAREWAAHLPAVEPATFTCHECDEQHPLVPGEDDSLWCVCGARLDEQRDRIARDAHDFETEGRQSERTVTACAVCGLNRSAAVHR
jgi:hypothetical protein